jgi:hypothetical protein
LAWPRMTDVDVASKIANGHFPGPIISVPDFD